MANMDQNIREDMEVVGSDGKHVGTVDKVEGDQIKLTKSDAAAGGMHHRISMDMIDSIEGDRVMLSQSADEVMSKWGRGGDGGMQASGGSTI